MKKYCSVLCLLAVAILGCGGDFVGLSGRVTYSDNGEPLEKGTVVFVSGSLQAIGEIEKDGKYVVGSRTAKDGLPPGTYKVFVAGAVKTVGEPMVEKSREQTEDHVAGMSPGGMTPLRRTAPLIDLKFANPDTSGLTLDVSSSTRRFDFKVDRASGR